MLAFRLATGVQHLFLQIYQLYDDLEGNGPVLERANTMKEGTRCATA
jgi:hypothetical protein